MGNEWTERIEELEESRNNWKREWSLLNAALNMAEDRIKELEAENKRLRELVDGARVIVEVFQWSTPAQERWREEWLNKAREALKEASHE